MLAQLKRFLLIFIDFKEMEIEELCVIKKSKKCFINLNEIMLLFTPGILSIFKHNLRCMGISL